MLISFWLHLHTKHADYVKDKDACIRSWCSTSCAGVMCEPRSGGSPEQTLSCDWKAQTQTGAMPVDIALNQTFDLTFLQTESSLRRNVVDF